MESRGQSGLRSSESEARFSCPYCGSRFKSKSELSKHTDRVHTGSGLLEGDTRKW
ncbi:MAG: C2H2-type zinc finger protein [Nitrososphaerales archaeon]